MQVNDQLMVFRVEIMRAYRIIHFIEIAFDLIVFDSCDLCRVRVPWVFENIVYINVILPDEGEGDFQKEFEDLILCREKLECRT